jgi:threonine synthase
MDYEINCSVCGKPSQSLLDFQCPYCGSPLNVLCQKEFQTKKVQKKAFGHWRYGKFFPYVKEKEAVTLGEGWTPFVKFSSHVRFKLESLNPTGSFKDRGSTTLISALHRLTKKAGVYISEDSSGNAGASVAAYAARVGLKAKIYVPENVSGPKLNQIQVYGAKVVRVRGSRSEVAEEAQKPETGKFYVGHVLHPLFRDGIRSLAYEIAEQLDWRAPERIYLPVSAGTLLLGVVTGFNHLVESGTVEAMPIIVACQTTQVSPLYHRLKKLSYKPPERAISIADALVSVNPPLLEVMVDELIRAQGDAVVVDEKEILEAFKEIARHGFFVEPSSAVAYAAFKKQLAEKITSKSDNTVVILTGSGLKTALMPSIVQNVRN